MLRAIGYLLSEALWTLVFKLAPPQNFEDDDAQSAADATAARTKWIRDHQRPPEGG